MQLTTYSLIHSRMHTSTRTHTLPNIQHHTTYVTYQANFCLIMVSQYNYVFCHLEQAGKIEMGSEWKQMMSE
jgi:hypothetical protein